MNPGADKGAVPPVIIPAAELCSHFVYCSAADVVQPLTTEEEDNLHKYSVHQHRHVLKCFGRVNLNKMSYFITVVFFFLLFLCSIKIAFYFFFFHCNDLISKVSA